VQDKIINLSSQQQTAVEYVGPALVVAGAGSGKTRTLTAKFSHLIDQGFAPNSILAITFTNKAADEMKGRLIKLTGLTNKDFQWVRTYHSACFKILKKHIHFLNYKPPIQIYSDYQQKKLLKEILADHNIDKKFLYMVQSRISFAKNSGDPITYLANNRGDFYFHLEDIFNVYEQELFNRNAVDFDNILLKTRDLLLTNRAIRRHYKEMFSYILVDEYQDTNNLQEELTHLLVQSGNLFCVGDDWQAIYGFRGSNLNHFYRFSNNYQKSRIFRLEQNYRSSEKIVAAANDLISFNSNRIEKTCYSRKSGGVVEFHDFYNDNDEAQWVAQQIGYLGDENIAYNNIAILYRTKFCSLPFEQIFRSSGVPYQMIGSKGFFDRKEVLDITCYLNATVFEKDEAAFERIVNIPKRGIGPGALKKIRAFQKTGMSLQNAVQFVLKNNLLPGKNYEALNSIMRLLDDIRDKTPTAAINEILDKTGYLEYLRRYSKTEDAYISRQENIEQLIYSASQHLEIIDYLEDASLIKEDRKDPQERNNKVNLSTIHASKGMEYQVVFIVGCEENLLPHWKSMKSDFEIQEERRLMYVAMTRAENFLYLSSADYRKGKYNPPSRFLSEMDKY